MSPSYSTPDIIKRVQSLVLLHAPRTGGHQFSQGFVNLRERVLPSLFHALHERIDTLRKHAFMGTG